VLFRLRVTVLFGHAKVNHVNNIGRLCSWSSDEEVVWFDVTVDEILLVDGLYARKLAIVSKGHERLIRHKLTICFATITTVFMENFRWQWSKRSSRLGPRRSMTRML